MSVSNCYIWAKEIGLRMRAFGVGFVPAAGCSGILGGSQAYSKIVASSGLEFSMFP